MSFDYNINNYTINELEDLLELDDKKNYETNIIEVIENKKNIILNSILNDSSIDNDKIQKITDFLEEVTNKLIYSKKTKKTDNDISLLSTIKSLSSKKQSFQNEFKGYTNQDLKLKESNVIETGNNFIIETKPEANFYSSPSEYFRGEINPLRVRTIPKHLTIDTRFRSNYYLSLSSDCLIDLPIKFVNVLSMSLENIEFPSTYFTNTITEDSNYFTIIIDNVSKIFTIPPGNYTPSDALLYLNALIESMEPPFSYLSFNLSLTETGTASGNGRMVISTNMAKTLPFNFVVDFQADKNGNPDYSTPLPLKLGWFFGYREGIYTNNSSYVSEGVMDLIGRRYVFLSIDEFCNNKSDSYYSAFNNSLLNKNILYRISTSGNNFTYQSQQILLSPLFHKRIYFGSVDITKLKVQLLDEYGRVINLNNMDFSFSLLLDCAYKDI